MSKASRDLYTALSDPHLQTDETPSSSGEKAWEQYRTLCQTLDQEQTELLESLLQQNMKTTGFFEEQAFDNGFFLGARLMLEILQK